VSKLICIILLLASCITNAREIELTRRNSYLLSGPINGMTMAIHTATIAAMSASTADEVYVLVYSPGGAVQPVLFAEPVLKGLKNVSTVTIMAASMGAAIVQVLPGRRYIVQRGQMLFHRIRFDFEGEVTLDTVDKMREFLQADDKVVNHMCHNRLLIPYSQYVSNITNKNWILDAREALQAGAVDEIIVAKCNDALKALNVQVPTYNEYMGIPVSRNICDLL